MTDESICMKCLQLTRVWIKDSDSKSDEEKRICRVEELDFIVYPSNITVTKCSQFIHEKTFKKS